MAKRPMKEYERVFLEIESWVRTRKTVEENYPLLLVFEEGIDQIRFFVQFMEYHHSISETPGHEYFLPVLASLGSPLNRPGYALYSIMNRLREMFNIRQRVSHNEHEMRKYFGYWLGLANDKLMQWVTVEKDVVLFFESVDKMKEREASRNPLVGSWLPKVYPPRVKCVLACTSGTHIDRIITRMNYKRIDVKVHPDIIADHLKKFWTPEHLIQASKEPENQANADQKQDDKRIERVFKKDLKEPEIKDPKAFNNKLIQTFKKLPQTLQSSLPFAEIFFGFFSVHSHPNTVIEVNKLNLLRMKNTDFRALAKLTGYPDAIEYLVRIFSSELNYEPKEQVACDDPQRAQLYHDSRIDRFKELMKYLAATFKGLTLEELEKLSNLNRDATVMAVEVLKPALVQINGYYRFYCEPIISHVKSSWIKEDLPVIHRQIGEGLNSAANSVRKLEEQILNLFEAKAWFLLKQIISAIENFLILFNPAHKYLLSLCWGSLVRQNYDPVIEYNKALELFEMHYQPTIENLFQIILQLSRFFKELVDFEGEYLPEFRHPLIRNRLLTLQQKATEVSAGPNSRLFDARDPAEDSRLEVEEFSIDSEDSEREEHMHGRCKNHLEDIGLLREVKRMKIYDRGNKCEILKGYEKANVDIPAGLEVASRDQEYLDVHREFISKKKEKLLASQKESEEPAQDPTVWNKIGFGLENLLGGIKKVPSNTNSQTALAPGLLGLLGGLPPQEKPALHTPEASVHNVNAFIDSLTFGDNRKYYFYKRWVWIMFPWACMSIDPSGVFSDQIHRCFESDLKYIKVIEELELTQKAQLIAIEAKEKKKAVLEDMHGDYLIDEDLKEVQSKMTLALQPNRKDSSATTENTGVPLLSHGLTRKNTASNLKSMVNEGRIFQRKMTADLLSSDLATGGLKGPIRPFQGRPAADHGLKRHPSTLQDVAGQPQGIYLTAVQSVPNPPLSHAAQVSQSQGQLRSHRSLLSANVSQQRAAERLGVGYSELDLKNMGNVCHTNIKAAVGQHEKGMRNMMGVQRMMRDVRDILEVRSSKEQAFMESKNAKMATSLNQLIYENTQALRKLESLRNELKKDGTSLIKPNNFEATMQVGCSPQKLVAQCAKSSEKFRREKDQQTRLMKIIDICRMNKNTNEEWIRQLNFFIANMTKMSKKTELRIDRADRETADLNKLVEKVKDACAEKEAHVGDLLDTVNHNIAKQAQMDGVFMSNYTGTAEAASDGFQRFAEAQSKSQALISPPKVPVSQEAKNIEKENLVLLEEFRRDFGKLSGALGLSEKALLKSKGRLAHEERFQSSSG